jgi:hypothetical protein
MSHAADMIERRSELLAKVVLTRRLNIDVFRLDEAGEIGIDFLCSIRDEKIRRFLPFGVVVKGTADQLDTSEDAAKHVRTHWKKLDKRTRCFFPVIVLLFSMYKDEAFFSWLVEPCEDASRLVDVADLDFKAFDVKQLDRMTRRITNWYMRLATILFADAGEIHPSQGPDGE